MLKKKSITKACTITFYIFFIYLSITFEDFIQRQIFNPFYQKLKEDNFFHKENEICDKYDPILLMSDRFKKRPIIICENEESKHICYQNSKHNKYNKIYSIKLGVICKIENFILDPLKSKQANYIYKGPVDKIHRGSPILSKGFFNMKCQNHNHFRESHRIYRNYFESWNYDYETRKEQLQELAPGKIVLLMSRNQDSPNLFHGISELINVICVMYLLNLKPENIQIIFLESMKLENDPLINLYTHVISRGGKPIYIRDLKRKYHIESAIHIPINWDSPVFINLKIPKGYPNCKYSTKTYNILNNLINKYINIPIFKDSFTSNNDVFYYPESVIQNYKSDNGFNKTITIQWRKVWPRGRTFQNRILANGPELADKLASALPKNYLIRLVDTASLSINEQISIMRKTDYLIGVHGAGLSLSIFMPPQSILYEILPKNNIKVLLLMSALSGHKTFSDILKSELKIINNNDFFFFDGNEFSKKFLKYIKDNEF